MNSCVYMGRITNELELSKTNGGVSVLNFSIAVRKQNGNGENDSDFLPCVAYGSTAEFIERNTMKGCRIMLRCRNTSQTYEDKETKKTVYKTVSKVEEADIIDFKEDKVNPDIANG